MYSLCTPTHTLAMSSLQDYDSTAENEFVIVPNEYKATSWNPPHCNSNCNGKYAIKKIPHKVYVKQSGGLKS